MRNFRTFVAIVMAAATMSFGAVMPVHAQNTECLTENQIQQSIEAGTFKSWPKIRKLAQIARDYQEVSDVQVCLVDGVPYYQVNVVTPDGQAMRLVVNAIDGSQ